jgi:hypothetical protein
MLGNAVLLALYAGAAPDPRVLRGAVYAHVRCTRWCLLAPAPLKRRTRGEVQIPLSDPNVLVAWRFFA